MPNLAELETKYFPDPFGPAVHSKDTAVIPHVDGDSYFAAIGNAINQCTGAGSKIHITSWFFNAGLELPGTGGSLATVLAQKAADYQVDVRIIIAAPRFSVGTEGRMAGIEDTEHLFSLLGELAFANVIQKNVRAVRTLRGTDPGGGLPLADRVLIDWGGCWDSRHEKSTTIYNATTGELQAFVGGMDFSPDRMSPEIHTASKYWHDVGVELRGGAAAAVLDNFRTRWAEVVSLPEKRYMLDGIGAKFNPVVVSTPPSQPTTPPTPPTAAPPGGYLNSSVRIVRSYDSIRAYNPWIRTPHMPWATLPAGGVQEIFAVLQKAIRAATRYVYVEDQTLNPGPGADIYVTHRMLMPYILDACRRNVKVIFVTDGFSGADSPVPARLTMAPAILEGVLNHLSLFESQNFSLQYVLNTKVHSKVVLVDDEFVSIGSANFWDRSMTGKESELAAAIVHEGGASSLVADLRVRLWRNHLGVASSATVDSELRDLERGLSIFRADWGTGTISFARPNNALRAM
jgi:phosphatidylserine/phosphatidylglycerophosphate/cardiolipin synthase-like enzyme